MLHALRAPGLAKTISMKKFILGTLGFVCLGSVPGEADGLFVGRWKKCCNPCAWTTQGIAL